MKPKICKHFMYHNYFDVSDINCVVIDECHLAFGNDPLVSICSRIKAHPKTKPLILAMTASLIPSKICACCECVNLNTSTSFGISCEL